MISTDNICPEDSNRLLFVGSLKYAPNVQGLLWFVNSIFPALLAQRPSVQLSIVGRNPADSVLELKKHPNIDLHINVPDVAPYYASCKAVVVPLLSGSGTRIKILEAMLNRRPVIATPVGYEGLEMGNKQELLSFESAAQFTRCFDYLDDNDNYVRIVNRAFNNVQSNYSTKAFHNTVAQLLSDLKL